MHVEAVQLRQDSRLKNKDHIRNNRITISVFSPPSLHQKTHLSSRHNLPRNTNRHIKLCLSRKTEPQKVYKHEKHHQCKHTTKLSAITI